MKFRIAFLVALSLLVGSTLVGAQALPAPQCAVLQQLGAKFGTLNQGSDDQRREFALKVAQQFAFSFPGEGWGSKDAGGGRPQTKDAVARVLGQGALIGYDLVNGDTRQVVCGGQMDLTGQHFIDVTPHDWLGTPKPVDPPVVTDPATSTAVLAELRKQTALLTTQNALTAETNAKLDQLRADIIKAMRDFTTQILPLLLKGGILGGLGK